MPQRVPYGFHSTWIPEGEFQQQWAAAGRGGLVPPHGQQRGQGGGWGGPTPRRWASGG